MAPKHLDIHLQFQWNQTPASAGRYPPQKWCQGCKMKVPWGNFRCREMHKLYFWSHFSLKTFNFFFLCCLQPETLPKIWRKSYFFFLCWAVGKSCFNFFLYFIFSFLLVCLDGGDQGCQCIGLQQGYGDMLATEWGRSCELRYAAHIRRPIYDRVSLEIPGYLPGFQGKGDICVPWRVSARDTLLPIQQPSHQHCQNYWVILQNCPFKSQSKSHQIHMLKEHH
jgi:hypothetical protein